MAGAGSTGRMVESSQLPALLVVVLLLAGPLFICSKLPITNGETACDASVEVKEGDTCFSIAKAFNSTIAHIKEANPGINCTDLQIGQKVCL
ncbi:hypothetical protein L7F22_013573 [Adiantum nelumboides]|nr:hypothetical protein [Adiantum nelumboides]